MMVYLNGDFVAEAEARVPVTDRGFLLGDALFETLRVANGVPLLWEAHLERFTRGLALLQVSGAGAPGDWQRAVRELLRRNALREAVVRITVTRGSGARGYSPRGAVHPTVVITAHPAPAPFGDLGSRPGWHLITSRYAVPPPQPLSGIKHANRLLSVLARMEADAVGADEALMLGAAGQVAEASGSNVGWFEGDTLVTPDAATGALPGVQLDYVGQTARRLGWACRTASVPPGRLQSVVGLFLTNSIHLLVPVARFDDHSVPGSPKIAILQAKLRESLLSGPGGR